jgi:hypothetical protein
MKRPLVLAMFLLAAVVLTPAQGGSVLAIRGVTLIQQ